MLVPFIGVYSWQYVMRDLFVSRPKNEERAPMKVRTKLDFRENDNEVWYRTNQSMTVF
jgi:hypothetical protein